MIEYVVLVIDGSWHCDCCDHITIRDANLCCDPMRVSKADLCNVIIKFSPLVFEIYI